MSSIQNSKAVNDHLFEQYSKDIKYVRSLVNLWRDEFDRRNELGMDLMEAIKVKPRSEVQS